MYEPSHLERWGDQIISSVSYENIVFNKRKLYLVFYIIITAHASNQVR